MFQPNTRSLPFATPSRQSRFPLHTRITALLTTLPSFSGGCISMESDPAMLCVASQQSNPETQKFRVGEKLLLNCNFCYISSTVTVTKFISSASNHSGARLYGPQICGLLAYKVNILLVPVCVSYTTL